MTINLSDPAIRARLDNPFKRYKGPKKIVYFEKPPQRGRPTKDENRRVAKRMKRSPISKSTLSKQEGNTILTIESAVIFNRLMYKTIKRNSLQFYDFLFMLICYVHAPNRNQLFAANKYSDSFFPAHWLRQLVLQKLVTQGYFDKRIKGWYMWKEPGLEIMELFWKEYKKAISTRMKAWDQAENNTMDPDNAPKRYPAKKKPTGEVKKKWQPKPVEYDSIGARLSRGEDV